MSHKIYSYQPSLAEEVAADDWKQFQTNVRKAAFDRETVIIGGGEFDGESLRDMVTFIDNCVARQGMALADMKNMSEENETLKATVKELLAEIKRLSDIVDNIHSAP